MDTRSKTLIASAEREAKSADDLYNQLTAGVAKKTFIVIRPSSVAERLRRRLCNQKIAGSNPASGHLATSFRKEI